MKMKKKRLLGILLSLTLVLGLMPGMTLTAYADNTVFNPASKGNSYENSDIKSYVEGLTGAGQPLEGISRVISGVPYLIDKTTAEGLSGTKRTEDYTWWLSSPGTSGDEAVCVSGGTGTIYDYDVNTSYYSVRPALQLDLSKVMFDSTANTFSLKPEEYEVTYKVVNGTWSDGSTTDKKETVQSGSKPASIPTGMKVASGYTGGSWDTNPTDATITGATTFTYTFTEKQAATVTKSPTAKTLTYNGSAQELVTATIQSKASDKTPVAQGETKQPAGESKQPAAEAAKTKPAAKQVKKETSKKKSTKTSTAALKKNARAAMDKGIMVARNGKTVQVSWAEPGPRSSPAARKPGMPTSSPSSWKRPSSPSRLARRRRSKLRPSWSVRAKAAPPGNTPRSSATFLPTKPSQP